MINHILFISGGEIVMVMLLALLFFGSKAYRILQKQWEKECANSEKQQTK